MLFLFIYCQALVLIEIIILTVYHVKARDLEKSFGIDNIGEYFTKIYRDLIIIGYSFRFIYHSSTYKIRKKNNPRTKYIKL